MSLSEARQYLANTVAEWRSIRLADLQFWHGGDARLLVFGLVALAVFALVARSFMGRQPGRHRLMVPALLTTLRPSYLGFLRHLPLLLFLVGLPFFALAIADPFTSLVTSEVSYPGRRIAVMIDASTSMRTPFKAAHLNTRNETDATFFTTVAAAERFIRMRMNQRYRDLMALVEFGNEAYVVTPFTNDYDNILLSVSLIGDPVEYSLFPDQGTIIAAAIDQGIGLFKAFNFLDATGNIMVLFSDGEDTRVQVGDKTLDEILQNSVDNKIPVYMVRTNYDRGKGMVIPDEIWIPAIEKTGGRFYAANSEDALLAAIADIDKVAAGTIATKQYTSQRPRFAFFALAAAASWLTAAALKLSLPQFQKVP
ncbi:MAG: VWA domain-containing protein [Acidobacteria bacterium]|nr:VWA domain-containing protein [Acidobacteriota bacterium]